jgi:hypothetical protein
MRNASEQEVHEMGTKLESGYRDHKLRQMAAWIDAAPGKLTLRPKSQCNQARQRPFKGEKTTMTTMKTDEAWLCLSLQVSSSLNGHRATREVTKCETNTAQRITSGNVKEGHKPSISERLNLRQQLLR